MLYILDLNIYNQIQMILNNFLFGIKSFFIAKRENTMKHNAGTHAIIYITVVKNQLTQNIPPKFRTYFMISCRDIFKILCLIVQNQH